MYKVFIEYFDTDPETGELATERTRSLISGRTLDMALVDPSIDLALNKAGKAEFTVPAQHPFYSKIIPMTTNVEITEDIEEIGESNIIFFGRVSKVIRGWNNQKKVTCEGAFAFFNDTVQRWKKYPSKNTKLINFVEDVLDRHNDQIIDESRKIYMGTMTMYDLSTDNDDLINEKKIYRLTEYNTTLDVFNEMCIESEGGYMFVHRDEDEETGIKRNYLDWTNKLTNEQNQPAKFGLNLIDLNQEFDSDELYTALLPLGANYDKYVAITPNSGDNPSEKGMYVSDGEGGYVETNDTTVVEGTQYYEKRELPRTIKNATMPSGQSPLTKHDDYIQDDNAVTQYGFILKTKRWDDISDKSKLLTKALQWMKSERFDKLMITCDVADLHNLDHSWDPFLLGKIVAIVSPPHGITADNPVYLPISEIHYDLNNGKKQVTIGTQTQVTLSRITKTGKTKEVRVPDAKYDYEDTPT